MLSRIVDGFEWTIDMMAVPLLYLANKIKRKIDPIPVVGSVWVYHPYVTKHKDNKSYLVDVLDANEEFVFYSSYHGTQNTMRTSVFKTLYIEIKRYRDD